MIPSKIVLLCLVGFLLLADFIEARPAPDDHKKDHEKDGGSPHKHHYKKSGGTHHHKTSGSPHTHHFKVGGSGGDGGGGGGGAGGSPGGDSDGGAGGHGSPKHNAPKGGGSGGLGNLPGDVTGDAGLGGDGSGGLGNLPGDVTGDAGLGGGGSGGLGNLAGDATGDVGLGGGGTGNLVGDVTGDVGLNGGGSGGLGGLGGLNLDLSGFSPDTILKFKNILGKLNIDPSQLSGLLGGLGGGLNFGGAGGGKQLDTGNIHKYDGKDSLRPNPLQPHVCADSVNDRYGVGKHFVRGTRDVGNAIFSEAEYILEPIFGGTAHGLGQGLKALLCAIENGFSDFGSDFDSATDIAKHGLVNFFKLQGPNPILGIPVGIAGIAGEAVKAAGSIASDAANGIQSGLGQLLDQLG